MFLHMLFCLLYSYKTKRYEILHSISMNLKYNTDFLILILAVQIQTKRCIHITDECKQKEAFMTELFETVPNSVYKEFFLKKNCSPKLLLFNITVVITITLVRNKDWCEWTYSLFY